MTTTTRTKYERLLRVQEFGTAHRPLFPDTSAGAKAFTRIDDVVARIEALAEARAVMAAIGRKEMISARATLKTALREIGVTARGIEHPPGGSNTLVLPRRMSDLVMLTAARSFAREAEGVQTQLTDLGLAATFIADLEQAADAFETTMQQRRAGRRAVAASNAGLKAAFSDGSRALARLDIVVPNVVRRDPAILAAWQRDRAIVDGRSPATPADAGESMTPTPRVTPPAPDVPAEAPADVHQKAS